MYGLAGTFNEATFTSALMVGIGVGSLVLNFIRMIFLVSLKDYYVGAICFFTTSGAFLFLQSL